MILNSADQIFDALLNGQLVYWCECGSDDWSPLNDRTQINFVDLYTGFLQFKADELPVIPMPVEFDSTHRYFSEYIKTFEGLEIYRVGKTRASYFALRVKSSGTIADYFCNTIIYSIQPNGSLRKMDKSITPKWILDGLENARVAMRKNRRHQVLESTGFFASEDYKNFKRNNRPAGVR